MFITMITRIITDAIHAIAVYKMKQRTIKELNMLSDRDLLDIGITRYDIADIAKYDASMKMFAKSNVSSWNVENA